MRKNLTYLLKILTNPKEVILAIVEEKDYKTTYAISIIVGMSYWLFQLQASNFGEEYNAFSAFVGAFVVGGGIGLLALFLFSYTIKFVSKKSRGAVIDIKELQAAVAWGSTPMLVSILYFIIISIIFKEKAFTLAVDNVYASSFRLALNLVTGISVYRTVAVVLWPKDESTVSIEIASSKKKRKKRKKR